MSVNQLVKKILKEAKKGNSDLAKEMGYSGRPGTVSDKLRNKEYDEIIVALSRLVNKDESEIRSRFEKEIAKGSEKERELELIDKAIELLNKQLESKDGVIKTLTDQLAFTQRLYNDIEGKLNEINKTVKS